MSIGQPCKYCTHGKMRPLHFSWDQAVILCDNKKCKSILYASPSECIIKKDILQRAHQPFPEFDLKTLLSDGSAGSSSGVYSGARSSLPSPAQSRKSGTDEEVELLLKASYTPLSFKDCIDNSSESSGLISHTQVPPKIHTAHSDQSRYDGFFELLGNLDLEQPTQSVNTESHSESTSVETGLDVVTTELEGWMKDFDFPSIGTDDSNIFSDGCQQPLDEVSNTVSSGGCPQLPDAVLSVESVTPTTNSQGPCIPSHRSAFCPVDAPNDKSASLIHTEQNSLLSSLSCHSLSTERNETSEYLIQQCLISGFPVPFANELMRESMSTPTRFMSPTASAASEDSGYNEEDGKTSSISELAVGEESLKVSTNTFIHSSLKDVDGTTTGIAVKQSHQSNLKNLMQNSVDWPAMSGENILTVLPAMVTTENNLTDDPHELLRLSSVTQPTSSGEVCPTTQDEREIISFNTEQLDGGSHIPSEPCEDHELGTVSSENHDHTLADESHAVSISEPFDDCVVSQESECMISKGSSHSTFSESKYGSEHGGNSAPSLDTPDEAPRSSGDDKNKRGARKRGRNKFRSLGDINVRKHVPSNDNSTVPNSIASRIRDSASSASRIRDRGCRRDESKAREVKRRKSKISGFRYNEKGQQNLPLKKKRLKKSCNREQRKRPRTAHKVLPRAAKQQMSSWENQPPTSSGESHSAKNDSQLLHESDDERDFTTTQSPGRQIPNGRTSRLCRRVTNLSPRKLQMGQVNRDPWSVADLYLEEVVIEIIVGDQQEVSHHPDKAAKCDVQLQKLLSLFGKKQSESEMSHLTNAGTSQAFSSEVCGETSLEKENGEAPFKERSTVSYDNGDSEGKKIEKNSHENLSVNNEVNVKNCSNAINLGQTEHKIEQKDVPTNVFDKLPTGQDYSQFDVISKSHGFTDMTQEDSQPFQKQSSDNENLSAQIDVYSEANEGNSLSVQINPNNFFNEEAGFIKEQLVSNIFEGVCTSSLEEGDGVKTISNGQEAPLRVKQSFNKAAAETSSDSMTAGNFKLNMEGCEVERTRSVSSSIDQNYIEKLALESIDRQCVDDYGSALNIQRTFEYESPWFEKVCDRSLPNEREENLTEEQNFDKSVLSVPDQSGDIEACSTNSYPSTSPEASPSYFLNSPKFGPVRSWIGYEDDTSLTGNEFYSKEKIRENNTLFKSCPNLESEFFSSKYFQSLVEDMDFDENFLQCPVLEHPSETFFEHSKSSLFFGETASNFLSHIEVPKVAESDITCKDCSESNSTSNSFFQACDQHLPGSVTSTANTQIPLVPLPHNIPQVPITSVPTNISSCKVLSIIGKQNFEKKTLIIPNNPKVSCILTLPSGINSFDGSALSSSRPKLPSESLVLEAPAMGSSGKVNVTGKKLEFTSEINTSKIPIEQQSDCAVEFAGTSSLGDGRNQGNLSNLGRIKSDRNSEEISALSDYSPQDIVDKESRLDVLSKSESESTSLIANFTEILPSSSDSVSITMSCKEQTECQQDSSSDSDDDIDSDSDDDIDKVPIISLDSDDEILITIPGTLLEDGFASQEEKEYCITSDKNYMTENILVEDVPVDQYNISDGSINTLCNWNEIKEPEMSLTKTVNLGLKRKTDDEGEHNKKLKSLDTATEVNVEEYIGKHENQTASLSNSQCGIHMCGILDDSVPHDKHCCSSLHPDFEHFPAHMTNKESTHQTVKAYARSGKHCKSDNDKSTDDDANILKSCVVKESTENDLSGCSNAKQATTHTDQDRTVFDLDTKFGSVKASPQYDSYSCLRIEKEANDLDFFQLDTFGSGFLASLISPTEGHVSIPKASQERKDLEHCTPQESDMEDKEKENIATEASEHKVFLNEEITSSTSECVFITNNGDDLEDKRNIVPPKPLYIPCTDVISKNVNQFTTSCDEGRPLFRSRSRNNVIIAKFGSNVDCNKFHSTSDVELNQAPRKIIVLKSSQSSSSVSSYHSDASKKTLYFTRSLSLPQVSSHASTKVNTNTGATPHSHPILPPFHSFENMALHPLAVTPSSFAPSGTTNSQVISSGVQKQVSLIDYQIPVLENSSTLNPLPLVTNDENLSPTLAQSSHTVSTSTKGSMERIITLSGDSTHYPQTRLVRLVASTALSQNCMKDNKCELQKQKKDLESSNYDTTQESSSMLKKVKLGSKGFFYLRPTPALKDAILNMRKKEDNENDEDKEEEEEAETSSGYLTLPDGNPIPHPIFIPSKKSEVQLMKLKRKGKRRKAHRKKIKDLLKEKVKESLECSNKSEITKLMVIYARGSLHICQIDVTEAR